MEMKKLIIGTVILIGLVIGIYFIVNRERKNSGWTNENKTALFAALIQNPVFSCPNSYKDMVGDIMTTLEKNYKYEEAMSLVNGDTKSSSFTELLTPCLSNNCMAEVVISNYTDMPMSCGLCVVNKAIMHANGSRKNAAELLNNSTFITETLKSCVEDGSCGKSPAPSPNADLLKCKDKSLYVSCKQPDGSIMYSCDDADGYKTDKIACSQTDFPDCPSDVTRFEVCPNS